MDEWRALALIAALKLWVAAFGAFLLARALSMRWPGARRSRAWSTASRLWMVTWISYPHASVWALVPWALLAAEGVLRRPDPRRAALLALVIGLQFLCGHPESSFHLIVAVVVLRALRLRGSPSWRRATLGLVGGLAWGALLAALVLLPVGGARAALGRPLAAGGRGAEHQDAAEVRARRDGAVLLGQADADADRLLPARPRVLRRRAAAGARRRRATHAYARTRSDGRRRRGLHVCRLGHSAGVLDRRRACRCSRVATTRASPCCTCCAWRCWRGGGSTISSAAGSSRRVLAVAGAASGLPVLYTVCA